MKHSKKIFNRSVAYNAYCYYLNHEVANFDDTAAFISKLFNTKYTKNDIGKIFRHIVVFGNVDDTAKKLCHSINWRSKYDKAFYNRFLGYRYEYPELLKELQEYENVIYEKNQLQFLISEYKNFSYSEMDEEGYLEDLKKRYDNVCSSFNLLDFNYIDKLKAQIEKIERYRIKELII